VLSDETLLGGDNSPAVIEGYGPIPASVARDLVDAAVTDERSKATLRRLYRHPNSGALVAMESRSRYFPKGLARFIRLRDLDCRTPFCDAPIRHLDHANPKPATDPPPPATVAAPVNAATTSRSTGWRVATGEENGVHTIEFLTPTGARYRSTAPPPPGPPPHIWISEIETRIGITIAAHAA